MLGAGQQAFGQLRNGFAADPRRANRRKPYSNIGPKLRAAGRSVNGGLGGPGQPHISAPQRRAMNWHDSREPWPEELLSRGTTWAAPKSANARLHEWMKSTPRQNAAGDKAKKR